MKQTMMFKDNRFYKNILIDCFSIYLLQKDLVCRPNTIPKHISIFKHVYLLVIYWNLMVLIL